MHREHDPHEFTQWTSQLFPTGPAAPFDSPGSAAKPPENPAAADHHDHHHHDEGDPADLAAEAARRRAFQTWLTKIIGLLLAAELAIWLSGTSYQFQGWYSPARWAAIVGTLWSCHGVLENLLHGHIGADLALAQAALAALFLREDFVAAEVIFISLVGEWLEDVAYRRARQAIGELVEKAPRTARVLRDGTWQEIPAGSVAVGETVAIEAGEMVPVDGLVRQGRSSVDASSLTGESIPVDILPGSCVACGQINQFGRLEVEAQRVGMNSTLGQVVTLMTKAQARKSKIQRTADRYARYFLPAVEIAAGLTLLAGLVMGWPDKWLRAVAVLVVACPCPLVLATPATILAAWAVLARRGVMVKSGAAIEQLALCDTLAFDKTGTLTIGQPDLVRFDLSPEATSTADIPDLSAELVASIVTAVEASNPHPLAGAVVRGLESQSLQKPILLESTTFPGAGISGMVRLSENDEPLSVLVGNMRLMQENQIALEDSSNAFLAECDTGGETPLLVAIGGRLVAHIALADQVRPEAHDMVHDLKHLGFSETAILTGDRPGAAGRIGRKVHIKNVISELTPTQKAAWIQERHVAGRYVAMVGDGINDAPALAVARVGLAVSKVGANLATEAGDIILMHDPLRSLVRAREVSQAALKILKQNIFLFAFGLNGLAVLLAGLGILSPLAAAVFHQIGSLAVLCNALRLLAFDELKFEALSHRGEALLHQFDHLVGRAAGSAWAAVPSRRTLLVIAAVLLPAYYLGSGIKMVRYDEVLVRFRPSGSAETIGPGLYLGRPWPFEEVHRLRPAAWWSASLDAPGNVIETAAGRPGAWSPAKSTEETTDSLWLTGDGQLLQVEGVIQARPDPSTENLARLVRDSADPPAQISAEVHQQIRSAVAGHTLDELLSDNRKKIIDDATKKASQRLEAAGLKLAGLSIGITRVQPPKPVLDAFRDSARAQREAETLQLKTESSIATAKSANDSAISQLGRDALTNTKVIRQKAETSAAGFRSLLAARRGWPNLTDHRIFWSGLETILTDRPKIMLDVPPGDLYGTNSAKRHLILPDSPLPLGPIAAPGPPLPPQNSPESLPATNSGKARP